MKTSVKDRRVLRLVAIAGLLMVLAGLVIFVYLWSQPCTLVVNPGCGTPTAILTTEGSWMNSPTSLTVLIRNSGRQSTTLSAYYVKDASSHLYSAPTWNGPTIQPNSPLNVTFTIDGKDFTFQSHYSYTVTVNDSQGYNWTFSVTL